jgi:gliding motility-associated-like protein
MTRILFLHHPFSALKMRPIFTHFLTAGLFLLSLTVYGQPLITTFSPATVSAPIGDPIALQVRVQNFTNITSVQLPITYNGAVLEFVSINNSALPGFAAANYNATAGKITVSWFPDLAQYPNGFSLTDNTSMFTVNFLVKATGSSAVNIASVSPGIEVTRNNQVIQVSFGSGGSTVTASGGGPPANFRIIANDIEIPKDQTRCMPVTVFGFTGIVSLAYVMHWDPAVLQYQGTQGYSIPDLSAANFNVLPVGSNNLLMSWFDNSLNGVTRPNGATIYEVCFKGIGAVGSTSTITIDGVGFPPGGGDAEAINTSSQDLWEHNSGVADTITIVAGALDSTAVRFTADRDSVGQGDMPCVDVRVHNFMDIISIQFGMTYNPTIIQLKTAPANLQFGSNPLGLTLANFNTGIPGEIKFTWFDQNALGVDLPDSTLIFSVCFTAIGDTGTTSPFNFVSLPGLPIEVVKEPGGEVTPALVNGHVHIRSVVVPVLELNPTGANCNGSPTGMISATLTQGGPATGFIWSGPTSGSSTDTLFTNLMPGTYTVTVTVASGLTATSTTTVGQPAAISSSASVNNVSCNNGQDGSITLLPAGGTPAYSYAWTGSSYSNTTSNATITGLSAGTYTVTITDTRGCTYVSSPAINVTAPNPIQIAMSLVTINPVACHGGNNGSIALPNPTGGTGTHTFSWAGPGSFAATTKNIANLVAGTYTLTVMDANMCTRPFTYTVNAPTNPLTIAPSGTPTNATCFGANNGSAAVTVSGGTGNIVVSWPLGGQPISTGLNPTNLLPGSYLPMATDNNGCTAVVSTPIVVGGPTTAITSNPTVAHNGCAGEANGSITLAPAGGNGAPFTVNWPGGISGPTLSNLPAGTYSPTITDASGCTVQIPAIAVNAPPAITVGTITPTPQDGLTLGSVTISGVSGGSSPYTYSWSGPNGFTANTQNISDLTFGIYTLTITDANNCTMTATAEVTSTNVLVLTTVSPITASCNDDGCMTFNIPPGAVGPISIELLKQQAQPTTQTYFPDKDTFEICNLASGQYIATIFDAAGNSFAINNLIIAQNQQAIVSDSRNNPFDDLMNGSITVTPIPSNAVLTYQWNYNGLTTNTLTGLDSGTYVVTITNLASGCTSVNSYTLVRTYQPFQCSIVQTTQPTCLNTTNGSISISVQGADGPTYSYAWGGPNNFMANTQNITGLVAGAYTCTVTDESNVEHLCPVAVLDAQSEVAVTNVNVLSNYNGFQVSGATVCDGNASVVFDGQVGTATVTWSNGVTGISNTTLCGGDYTVTVTDALGCTATWQGNLTFPPTVVGSSAILSNYNGYGVSCDGFCDGRASVSAVGGVPPYRFHWPTGQVDANVPLGGASQANQLCGGNYNVTITDANNVATVFTFTVTEPDALDFEFASIAPDNFSLCDGQVIASVPAGAGDLTFTWSTATGKNGEGPRAEDLCAGERITFVVQDANGCTGIGNFQMPYPIDGCLQVRPILTPGSADDKNDYTFISCIEDYPENTFEVYNRWGQLVYQTKTYSNANNRWEGLTPGGQLLPDGVYFFVLKVLDNGNPRLIKGYINLLR